MTGSQCEADGRGGKRGPRSGDATADKTGATATIQGGHQTGRCSPSNGATEDRCFRCLAPNHLASACRDPVRCFRCRRFGHRKRECRAPRPQLHLRPDAHKSPCPPPPPP
ncbi:ATP-dependent RNA helicase glh-1-like [Setaria italica]|uniref:ATP-dependent RNA helicase glh-1-like n=1 Tax=Setaria italica TaxID=4555 RepID=UPI000646DCFA|nr:ATP-dependent RNA helicase glh-1-like [Setaria italica]